MADYQSLPDLGQTMDGKDDDGNLINSQFLGVIRRFDNYARAGANTIDFPRSYGPIWAVLLRNTSGGILLPKRLGLCEKTAGYNLIENVSGYTTAVRQFPCVAIDPWLHETNGVADDDLFWGIFRGPTTLHTPTAGGSILATATPGLPLIASADSLGRPTVDAPSSYTEAWNSANATFGTSLGSWTSSNTDIEINVLMHCPWFPAGG